VRRDKLGRRGGSEAIFWAVVRRKAIVTPAGPRIPMRGSSLPYALWSLRSCLWSCRDSRLSSIRLACSIVLILHGGLGCSPRALVAAHSGFHILALRRWAALRSFHWPKTRVSRCCLRTAVSQVGLGAAPSWEPASSGPCALTRSVDSHPRRLSLRVFGVVYAEGDRAASRLVPTSRFMSRRNTNHCVHRDPPCERCTARQLQRSSLWIASFLALRWVSSAPPLPIWDPAACQPACRRPLPFSAHRVRAALAAASELSWGSTVASPSRPDPAAAKPTRRLHLAVEDREPFKRCRP